MAGAETGVAEATGTTIGAYFATGLAVTACVFAGANFLNNLTGYKGTAFVPEASAVYPPNSQQAHLNYDTAAIVNQLEGETDKSKTEKDKNKEKNKAWEEDNRVPQDGETVLGDGTYNRTNKRVKGAKVYKKDGNYYHRDTLHKGKRSHLEGYDKNGNHLGEYDPTTGELIPGTRDASKKLPK